MSSNRGNLVNYSKTHLTSGGLLPNGSIGSFSAWNVTDFIDVSNFKNVYFKADGNTRNTVPIAFYDADKKFVSSIYATDCKYHSSDTSDSICADVVPVPSGAQYARIGIRNTERYAHCANADDSEWYGKICVFFGDSITEGVGTTRQYWSFLGEMMGIVPISYGKNANHWVTYAKQQIDKMVSDGVDPDAMFFFFGTNDWNANRTIGDWYTVSEDGTRTPTTDVGTFKGAITQCMQYVKQNYADRLVVLMTPIHRASFSNTKGDLSARGGKYLEDYVNAIKEASSVFSVECIDLYQKAGFLPQFDMSAQYFNVPETTDALTSTIDRLHTNAKGHERMAKVIKKSLCAIAIDFDRLDSAKTTSITLNKSTISGTVGGSETLIATVSPSDSTEAVTWQTNNNDIATVTNGVVAFISAGNAVITASSGAFSATCNVTIESEEHPDVPSVDKTKVVLSNLNSTLGSYKRDGSTASYGGWELTDPVSVSGYSHMDYENVDMYYAANLELLAIVFFDDSGNLVGKVGYEEATTKDVFGTGGSSNIRIGGTTDIPSTATTARFGRQTSMPHGLESVAYLY